MAKELNKNMNHHKKLTQYINSQHEQGYSKEEIRTALIDAGWDEEIVDHALQPVHSADKTAKPKHAIADSGEAPVKIKPAAHTEHPHLNLESDTPVKYTIFRSMQDTIQAIKNNFAVFVGSTVSSYLLASALLTAALFALAFIGASTGDNYFMMDNMFLSLGIFLAIFAIWYVFAVAFIVATMSLALNDGINEIKSSFISVLKNAAFRTPRALAANALVFLVSFGPLIILTIIWLALAFSGSMVERSTSDSLLSLLAFMFGYAWAIVALLRYALAPYIAVLEPKVPLHKTLARSNELLSGGGKWFIVKGFFLVIAVLIGITMITGESLRGLKDTENPIALALMLIVTVFIEGALVMLYHNRAIVKFRQKTNK